MFQFASDTGPVEVQPGGTSDPLPFPELASDTDPVNIFLRLVALGEGASAPTVTLHTDLTPPLTLTGEFASLVASDGTVIADASMAAEGDGTHRIRIVTHQLGTSWSLTIANPDATPRAYAVVVTDNRDQTRQPWIDVAPAVAFATTVDRPVSRPLPVTNRGTGRLTITEATSGSSVLSLSGIPATGIAPGADAKLTLTFTPEAVGTGTTTFTLASNDSTPSGQPPHNHRTLVTTTTDLLEAGTVLVLEESPQGRLLIAVDPHTWARRLLLRGQPLVGRSHPMVEADGRLLFVDGNDLVRLHPLSGQETRIRFEPPTGPLGPAALAPDGSVVAFRRDKDSVLRLRPDTGSWSVLTGGGSGPRTGIALAADRDGSVLGLVQALFGGTVPFRVDVATGDQRQISTGAGLSEAACVAVDARGRLLVGCVFRTSGGGVIVNEGRVTFVDPRDGDSGTLAIAGSSPVRAVAVAPDGTVVFEASGALFRVDPGTEATTPIPATAGVPSGSPVAIAVAPGTSPAAPTGEV